MGKKNEGKSVTKLSSKEKKEDHHKRRHHQKQSSTGHKSRSKSSKGSGSRVGSVELSPPSPTSSMKKGKNSSSSSTRPTLASVHETSTEADEGKSNNKEMTEEGKCLESSRVNGRGDSGNPTEPSTVDEIKSCPIYFGVRSYLHHFYETVNNPNTPVTEEDFLYLIHPKGRKCGAVWFKIGLIIGATLFLLGAIAIVIGYAIPKQDVVVGRNEEYEIVDKDAVRFNRNLDICKLIGLAGFCSGGLVLVISLLAPTFTSTYWEDDPATEPFRVSLSSSLLYESEPKSPIPVTEKIKCIQPIWSD